MKVLDVSHLKIGIDYAVSDIDSFHDQISAIQRAVRDFYALDDTLKGKGGKAIRTFFNEVHQPFLIFLYQSMVDYQNVLTKMKDATESFESHPNGFVEQEFLEQDVERGFDQVKKVTTDLTDEANSIIASVQDLVSVEKVDPSEVMDNVWDGKKKAKQIVEDLHTLDEHGTSLLQQTKDDLQTMRTYLSDIESKFKSGDLSVSNFNVDAVQGIGSYKAIMDGAYGEGYTDRADAELESLFEKMKDGETLTEVESEKLYGYLQNVMFDDKKRKEIEVVAGFINEKDIGKLYERLNDEVVISKDALEEEMAMIQSHVFLGNNTPSETDVDYDIRSKLEAYLMLLKNYHSSMENDNVILIGKVEYEKNHNDIPGHFLESVIETAEYNVDKDVMSKEKFRDFIFSIQMVSSCLKLNP